MQVLLPVVRPALHHHPDTDSLLFLVRKVHDILHDGWHGSLLCLPAHHVAR
jgi:hypothetical protein